MAIASDTTDLPPLRWASPVAAFQWAEEVASRPGYSCPLGRMVSTRRGVSNWHESDYRDLAYSILGAVASIPDALPREMFRCVFSVDSSGGRAPSLAERVAEPLVAVFPGKTYSQIRRIAEVSVHRARVNVHRGQRLGLSWYARALGIARPSLYDGGWREVIAAAEQSVELVLARGEQLAQDAIASMGVLGNPPT